MGAPQYGVLVNKLVPLDQLQLNSNFNLHWVIHPFNLMPHLS